MTEASPGTSKARAFLRSWEIPQECVLERLELWQKGRYGPICKGQLKNRDGSSSAVVVKSLRGTAWNIYMQTFLYLYSQKWLCLGNHFILLLCVAAADSSEQSEAQEFVDWIRFHATVCKHQNVVKMLFCQTEAQPISLILDAFSPGNLLSFLWTLRNVKCGCFLTSSSRNKSGNNACVCWATNPCCQLIAGIFFCPGGCWRRSAAFLWEVSLSGGQAGCSWPGE